MASNLKRSKRTVGKRVNDLSRRVSRLQKNPSPRRIGPHTITSGNLDPTVIIDINAGADVAVDFYANNNQNASIPTTPTINGDDTAITHVINTDSTATITFNWNYTTSDTQDDPSNIDGFVIHVYQSTSSSAYNFTSADAETTYFAARDKRSFVLVGVPADKYFTFGVKAYRVVDSNIDAAGVKYSAIVKSTFAGEDPFRPTSSISYTGTINGTAASTVATAAVNFNDNNDQNATTPTSPTINSDGTAVAHVLNTDASADISFEWNYTTSTTKDAANNIDGFAIYVYSSPAIAISGVAPSTPTSGSVTYTTATSHNLAIGDTVVISDLAPAGYNGTFTVTAVTSNTFRVANSTTTTVTDSVGSFYSTYTFGTAPSAETVYYVNADRRAFILSGVTPDLYYTFGVRAYRSVNSNIGDGSGVLYSTGVIKSSRTEENPYRPSATVAFTGNIGGTIGTSVAASLVSTTATNFSNNNDQNATTPTAPTISSDGTAVDHVLNTDASADISFEWTYTTSTTQGAANNIDGFAIYVYSSTSATPVTLGSSPATADKYTVYYVNADRRAFILSGVSPDLYYTFGVRAYRVVDSNIGDGSGVVYGATIVQPGLAAENPYQPSATVAFTGNIGGTLATSTPASNVYNATTNFNANNDQFDSTPNTPTSVNIPTLVQNTNASADLKVTWAFTTSTINDGGNIDGFTVYLRTIQPALIDSLSASGSVVTYTTKTAHGFAAGDSVVVSGISPAGYSGTFTVLSSPSPTTYTFAVSNTTTGTATYTTAQVYSATYSATDISISDLNTNIQQVNITAEKRSHTFLGVSPNSVYKVAIRAYRVVDKNVNANGVLFGSLANSSSVTPTTASLGGDNSIYIGTGKMFIGTGNYGNTNTGFYVDNGGYFSLKNKLTFNGTTLTIDGNGTFSGALSAATGTFEGRLQAGDIYIPSTGSPTFSVTSAGAVTATSGTIGGWSLATERIYSDYTWYPDIYTTNNSIVSIKKNGTIDTYHNSDGLKVDFWERVRINGYGDGFSYGIYVEGTASLSYDWRAYTSSGVVTPSDIRIKNVIDKEVDALSILKKIETFAFTYKKDVTNKEKFGFSAQQLHEHIADAVAPGDDDPEKKPWTITNETLVPYTVKAIQQLTAKVEDLEERLAKYER